MVKRWQQAGNCECLGSKPFIKNATGNAYGETIHKERDLAVVSTLELTPSDHNLHSDAHSSPHKGLYIQDLSFFHLAFTLVNLKGSLGCQSI